MASSVTPAANPIYHERESKTDAGKPEDPLTLRGEFLDKVRAYILADPENHYISPNDVRFIPKHLRDIPFHDEDKQKPIRYRVNYDAVDLLLQKAGIEIRVEKKIKLDKKAGLILPVFTMTVKMGDNTADRLEVEVDLPDARPDLDSLHASMQKLIKKKLGIKDLSRLDIRPMSQIVVQSWKAPFHPDGDLQTRVEHKNDRGRLTTAFGQKVNIFQTEQEVIFGDVSYRDKGRKMLLRQFPFLSATDISKPAEGYIIMAPLLEDKKLRKAFAATLPSYVDPTEFAPYYSLPASETGMQAAPPDFLRAVA